jgi:sialic acid synthase SpsE
MVIAEIGVNHNGDLDRAKKMVLKANSIGANAVKFQMFRPEALVTPSAKLWHADEEYQKESALDWFRRLALSPAEFTDLKRFTDQVGIEFLASVYDHDSLRDLVKLDVRAIKLGSCEITNEPLLKASAETGLPIILSTGASDLEETKNAFGLLKNAGAEKIVLMHCVSHYPAKLEDANVLAVKTLRAEFDCPIGYSDHTSGYSAVLGSVALGARVIEKHFTLSKHDIGPDHQASADVEELKDIITKIRNLERALGHGEKKWAASEEQTRRLARKSLVAVEAIRKGTRLSKDIIAVKRPGTGVPPKYYEDIENFTTVRDIEADETITWNMLEGPKPEKTAE